MVLFPNLNSILNITFPWVIYFFTVTLSWFSSRDFLRDSFIFRFTFIFRSQFPFSLPSLSLCYFFCNAFSVLLSLFLFSSIFMSFSYFLFLSQLSYLNFNFLKGGRGGVSKSFGVHCGRPTSSAVFLSRWSSFHPRSLPLPQWHLAYFRPPTVSIVHLVVSSIV